jgi:hypothetical protein
MQLHAADGARKYLTADERDGVLRVDFAASVAGDRKPEEAPDRHLPYRAGAPALVEALDTVHGIRELQARPGGQSIRLWPWSRMTGWRAGHAVMDDARLDGPHASPKGLRHGVAAVSAGIPRSFLLMRSK